MAINIMTTEELSAKIMENEDLLLIDCREQNEWDNGHIKQAQLMPLSQFEQECKKLDTVDKGKQIVIQCRSGKRSMQACQFLEGLGFNNLHNLDGGILDWEAQGFDVETD